MYEIIKLDTEITNRCNAACPQCPRTGTYKGVSEVISTSGIRDVRIEVFDEILGSESGKNINKVTYCGNYGDPIMHPKAMEIFKKVHGYGVKYQNIDTNGSVRSPEWWAELAQIPGFHVTFAIDGLEDTNHLYRVNTRWDRLMENVKAYIGAGGEATWVFIVFDHNDHQVEEAKALSVKLGFKNFFWKASTRKFKPESPTKPGVQEYKRKEKDEVKVANIGFSEKSRWQASLISAGLIEHQVNCMAKRTRQLFLTSDERILQCCHVQPTVWERKFIPHSHKKEPEFADFIETHGLKTELEDYSFDEIVESYSEIWPYFEHAWEKRQLRVCNRKCGSNFKNEVRSL